MTAAAILNERRRVVASAGEFGRVAVLYGGNSSEREVSLVTGKAVQAALEAAGVDATPWDPKERGLAEFDRAGFDRAFIALHGPGGEDGAIQGALEWFGVPYTGSGVMASALAMDKVRSKRLFEAAGIPTPPFLAIRGRADAIAAASQLGYPLIVKPAGQGSSVGMSKVLAQDELGGAVDAALLHGDVAIVEHCIVGKELTVGVLQGEALPSIRIETPRIFYDYHAKYESDQTRYFCPGTDTAEAEAEYAAIAVAAFAVLGCTGWGRVDFMTGSDGCPQVLEVNTIPGMTSHSLVPMAAKQAGIDFGELCWRILETSFEGAAAGGDSGGTRHGT